MATIRKRGDSYSITVSCGYDSQGKKIRKYTTWTPAPGMSARKEKAELEKYVLEFESFVRGRPFFERMTVSERASEYLQEAKENTSFTNGRICEIVFDKYLLPEIGHMQLIDVTPYHIQRIVNRIAKDVSASTARRYYVTIQAFFKGCERIGIIDDNPSVGAKILLPKMPESKTEIFDTEEIEKILTYVESSGSYMLIPIHLALATGMRRGEICALKWDKVDLERGYIIVDRSTATRRGGTVEKSTKTGRSRRIFIPEYLREMLLNERERLEKIGKDVGVCTEYVCTKDGMNPTNPVTITKRFSAILKDAGVKHKKFHALRHTSATIALSSGINVKNVSSRLGHAEISTTNRYVHAIDEEDKRAARVFDDLFEKVKK